jgi:hypothetical protein
MLQRFLLPIFCVFACAMLASAQTIYLTQDGKIKFNSDTPAEKIEATHASASCVLKPEDGSMAWKVLIKGFQFKKALMQEHFNENYMESNKFPQATFTGKIVNLQEVNFNKDGQYKVTVKGKMKMHGVEKDVEVPGTIGVKGKEFTLKSNFSVACTDYGIEIPAVVRDNIAKEIKISVEGVLKPKA